MYFRFIGDGLFNSFMVFISVLLLFALWVILLCPTVG